MLIVGEVVGVRGERVFGWLVVGGGGMGWWTRLQCLWDGGTSAESDVDRSDDRKANDGRYRSGRRPQDGSKTYDESS